MRAMKGYFDVRVAHDSEEAAQLLARTATIAARERGRFRTRPRQTPESARDHSGTKLQCGRLS
jgi:hypothetical protein